MADTSGSPSADRLLAALEEALGPRGVTTDPDTIAPLLTEWRGRWTGSTPMLVMPGSTAEVAAAVRICAQHGAAITPQGGNTGLVDGGTPYGEVLLSMRRMNQIRSIDPLNDAMTVDAGVVLAQAQAAAEMAERLFPLSLGSQGSATIGGLVSTNAGGVQVLRYGMMRDLVLGLEVVLPDGRIWDGLRGLRKDNTGYDLKQLFIGAEGTLGVVTAATLKLFPRPAAQEIAWAALAGPEQAVELLALAKSRSSGSVTGFELMSALAVSLATTHVPDLRDPLPSDAPWRLLIELSMPDAAGAREVMEALLADGVERGLVVDAALASSESQSRMMWRIRESIPIAERAVGKAVKHDISVAVSRIPDFLVRAGDAVRTVAPDGVIVAFGHVGDGNLHYNVMPGPADGNAFLADMGARISDVVHDVVCDMTGSISAEHGIGRMKRDELARRKSGVEMDLMRAIKRAVDPDGRMNPGRVL